MHPAAAFFAAWKGGTDTPLKPEPPLTLLYSFLGAFISILIIACIDQYASPKEGFDVVGAAARVLLGGREVFARAHAPPPDAPKQCMGRLQQARIVQGPFSIAAHTVSVVALHCAHCAMPCEDALPRSAPFRYAALPCPVCMRSPTWWPPSARPRCWCLACRRPSCRSRATWWAGSA